MRRANVRLIILSAMIISGCKYSLALRDNSTNTPTNTMIPTSTETLTPSRTITPTITPTIIPERGLLIGKWTLYTEWEMFSLGYGASDVEFIKDGTLIETDTVLFTAPVSGTWKISDSGKWQVEFVIYERLFEADYSGNFVSGSKLRGDLTSMQMGSGDWYAEKK
jgi:hypothetical protein